MKKYKYILLSLALVMGVSSCKLDTETYDQKDSGKAFSSLEDVQNGMNGAYYNLGYYGFLGNYAIALSDMCSGVSAGSSSSGHFNAYSTFTFSDTEQELEYAWQYGYNVVTLSTSAINGANNLIENGTIVESDKPTAYNYIGQCYALKALANYYLVNLFALPYSDTNKSALGIIIIDKDATVPFAAVSRGTVEQTYAQIIKDIKSAEDAFSSAGSSATSSAYYMGPMGLKALEARVYMSMGDYTSAETAAKAALTLKDKGDATATDNVPSNAEYLSMWKSISESNEDLFTIKKADDDNLSANSLNTLYGSYFATIQAAAYNKLGANDIRRSLLRNSDGGGISTTKYDGTTASASVSNIPIFRKSEMALIIAECEARVGTISEAQNYLMFTAKRNTSIKSVSDLPSTKSDLLSFISDERIREFFGEGHRFYDARRMGDIVSGDQFSNWDIQKFVFPIPAAEINTGTGCVQNENWSDYIPSLK
jgi:starch-binding outer membrane protein, SusD/RagB family